MTNRKLRLTYSQCVSLRTMKRLGASVRQVKEAGEISYWDTILVLLKLYNPNPYEDENGNPY